MNIKQFALLSIAAISLASCSDDDPAPKTSPYPTQQEFQEKVVGHIWALSEPESSVKYIKGDGTELDYSGLSGGWSSFIGFQIDNDGTITEYQRTDLPGLYPLNSIDYFRTTAPTYMYDPDTGILKYTTYKWTGEIVTREYQIISVSDNFIVFNDQYGIIPIGYDSDPYAEISPRLPDPGSHLHHILVRVPAEKGQEYYDKYKLLSFPAE